MATGSDLITQIRDILDEPVAAQSTDAQLIRWINEGNRDLARVTHALKDTLTIPAVAGASSYSVPSNVLCVEYCYYHDKGGDQYYPMTPRHMDNFDAVRGLDWAVEGVPMFFTTQGFAPNLKLVIAPTSPNSTDEFQLLTARLPVELTTGTVGDVIDTPTGWYDLLADYCEFKALRRDRDPGWKDAFSMYQGKRDDLASDPDYHMAARELVADPVGGYLPAWLVEFE